MTSKPTWSNAAGRSATSAFFFAPRRRLRALPQARETDMAPFSPEPVIALDRKRTCIMSTSVIVLVPLVSVLVAAVVLAFYMDWLGLWVSKEEMKEEIDRANVRMQRLEEQGGAEAPATGARAREETSLQASGTRT